MPELVRFVGSVPEYSIDGDNVYVTHPGMDPLVFPFPVFRAAVFRCMALIREIDGERRKNKSVVMLVCVTCGRRGQDVCENHAARS